jgi:hypothetical protein
VWIFDGDDLDDVLASNGYGGMSAAQESLAILAIAELRSEDLNCDVAPGGVDPLENDGRTASAQNRPKAVRAQGTEVAVVLGKVKA